MSKLVRKTDVQKENSFHISQLAAMNHPSMSSALLDDIVGYGSSNSAFWSTVYQSNHLAEAVDYSNGYMMNTSANDTWFNFALMLPTSKGSLKLYVKDIMIEVNAADANNYVDTINMDLMRDDASSQVVNEVNPGGAGNITAQGTYTITNAAADDASSYSTVVVSLLVRVNGANNFLWLSPMVECYYDE